jgi:hypothetical protein
MVKKSKVAELSPDQVADKVAEEIQNICIKYKCELGVWLSWIDLLNNFDLMKKDSTINELNFGLQIRLENGTNNQSKTSDTSTA